MELAEPAECLVERGHDRVKPGPDKRSERVEIPLSPDVLPCNDAPPSQSKPDFRVEMEPLPDGADRVEIVDYH